MADVSRRSFLRGAMLAPIGIAAAALLAEGGQRGPSGGKGPPPSEMTYVINVVTPDARSFANRDTQRQLAAKYRERS